MTQPIEIQTSHSQPAIKLQFDHREDRWAHRLIYANQDCEVEVMSSVEGSPDQVWPSSAPLQEVSRHSLEQGDALLCVGMAGKSHWSASYSVERNGQASVIKSDLACLQKASASDAMLGSTYELDLNCEARSVSENCFEILLDDQQVILIEALSGDDFQTTIELIDRNLVIRPSQISASLVVATRWGFVAKATV